MKPTQILTTSDAVYYGERCILHRPERLLAQQWRDVCVNLKKGLSGLLRQEEQLHALTEKQRMELRRLHSVTGQLNDDKALLLHDLKEARARADALQARVTTLEKAMGFRT